ncbi:MAG TPA: carboxypeptidase regulatory-like domain-containing protein [Gemmatimonadales bacterium]|jgi:plastocyanin
MRTTYISSLALVVLASSMTGAMARHEASAGGITGKVTFTGTPPKMRPIDMAKEPSCAKQHATPAMTETVVTGPGNTLENVVVYISAGGQTAAPPSEVVRYDQKGCEYLPHVAILQAGQPLEIYNDDETSHNIHPLAKVNAEWNKSQPAGAPPIKASYDKPEFIAVKCNVHPWMHGYFAVLSTSHAALTSNGGTYTIKDVPPGKYTVTAWHERFGTQTAEVTVGDAGPATADFVFKALPY